MMQSTGDTYYFKLVSTWPLSAKHYFAFATKLLISNSLLSFQHLDTVDCMTIMRNTRVIIIINSLVSMFHKVVESDRFVP